MCDAVLLLGPLYHLIEPSDREAALAEAHRVLTPGGILYAAAISRYASALDGLARDLLADGWRTALILTGGIEENGPYLTTGKHNHVLRVMGESIAREFGRTLVAPIVTIEPGNPERASSPGGIRYSQETYRAVLRDYAVSLKAQGFNQIFLMGDSGGNLRGMQEVADALRAEWAGEDIVIAHIPEYYNYQDVLAYQRDELGIDEDPRLEGLHDDYYITTIIMNEIGRAHV